MGTEGDNTRRCNCHRVSVAILNNGPAAYEITDATHKAKHTKGSGLPTTTEYMLRRGVRRRTLIHQ